MISVRLYHTISEAATYLRRLAARPEPWTFDIESYDGAAFPSRKSVSTDPHHPDFRVHGVAIATAADEGAYVYFQDRQPGDFGPDVGPNNVIIANQGLAALAAAFGSPAEKGAFNGHFDENGMVFPGWVPRVSNRTRDGMLAAIALGDGTHDNLRLPTLASVLLRREVTWEIDKSTMREQPLDVVADGAVHDACLAHELCDLLETWSEEDRRIRWSELTRAY